MTVIDKFRYIKIQAKTIDLSCGVYSPETRAEVYCLRLSFNISKLVYYELNVWFKSVCVLESQGYIVLNPLNF